MWNATVTTDGARAVAEAIPTQTAPGYNPQPDALRSLRNEMLALMAAVEAHGAAAPWAIVEAADRYLALIDAVVNGPQSPR